MWHIKPVEKEQAQGTLREVYDQDMAKDGYVWNTTMAWSHRPDDFVLWTQLIKSIRSHLRLRTFELVTLAASRAIGCKY